MTTFLIIISAINFVILCFIASTVYRSKIALLYSHITSNTKDIQQQLATINQNQFDWQQFAQKQQDHNTHQRQEFNEYRVKSLHSQQEALTTAMSDVRKQVIITLDQHTKQMNERVEKLTQLTEQKLNAISQEVDKQLSKGFEKTTATFTDILKRLTIIDQAQKKITELSNDVVNLQEVLTDKRSRGAFGEVQLANLIKNMLPEKHVSLQHTLSNNKRVDCLLRLPSPTGNLAVDAKFPLENYQKMHTPGISDSDRKKAESQFKDDIKKHILDIASKYIIPPETANGAIMFIPAEAIFADIHAYHPDVIQLAQQKSVWLVSPTTMMAVITTAKAVLKDEATRKQVHLIQEHLVALSKDFSRFQTRMNNLAKHIDQAQSDVSLVHKSSQKITARFNKIEQVDIDHKTEKMEFDCAE